jgi:hypothetical protein
MGTTSFLRSVYSGGRSRGTARTGGFHPDPEIGFRALDDGGRLEGVQKRIIIS